MKKMLVLILALMFIGVATQVYADNSNSAVARVEITVAPNIAVATLTPNVQLGSIQKGSFKAPFIWRIDANVEQVSLMLEASNLYKGDDPSTAFQLALDTGTPAAVVPANGNAVMGPSGHENILAWSGGVGAPIPGNPVPYPTVASETWAFESSTSGNFSQNVTTTISYKGPALELPQGPYSGKVRLTAFIVPPAPAP